MLVSHMENQSLMSSVLYGSATCLMTQIFGNLCRCEVVTEEPSSSEAVLLAKLKPFPAISDDGTCGGVTVPSDLKLVCYSMKCRFPSTCSWKLVSA